MSSPQNNEASKITAIKDQAVGAVKEAIGGALGNNKMQLEGKAQKIHGKNEYEYAAAFKSGETEPEKFQQAYHPQAEQDQTIPQETAHPAPIPPAPTSSHEEITHSDDPSQVSAWKDQAVGTFKQTVGSATNNPKMEIAGTAQKIHGHNEAEFAKANKEGLNEPQHFEHGTKTTEHAQGKVEGENVSAVSAMKDKAVGAVKETFGSATGNTNTELAGKAQQMHGRNEAEFAKAQKQGLNEPEHYVQGTKTTEHAEGSVEGQKVSSLGAIKDKAMGSIKETFGSMTGNQDLELKGKAQNIHGRNESEFVKAQKEGLSEPQHFEHGTKTTEHAEGKVEGENVSAISAMKDKVVGSVKETVGSATGNTNTELAGKAQQMHGRNEAEFAKAQKQGLNEPEHYAQGTKTTQHAEGEVVSHEPSKLSGWKDQAVGSVKETIGSATGNQKMEIQGKAQKIEGASTCNLADEHNTINA